MNTTGRKRKQHFQTGFIAGLLAGIIATGVMLLVSVTWNGISLPEVFGSALTALMPPPLFNYLHETIGGDAKHYFFYGIVVGQCLVFALSGGLYNLRFRSQRLPWYHGLILTLILWLFVGFILLPITGVGIFGAQLTIGLINSMLSLAAVGIVFGLSFVFIRNWLTAYAPASANAASAASKVRAIPGESDDVVSRRTLLRRAAVLTGIAVLGVGMWRFITEGVGTTAPRLMQHFKSKIIPPPIPNYGFVHPAPFLSAEVTSNDQYYIVSKNLFADPMVDGNSWKLVVDGEVEHPFVLTYQQVLALPMRKQYESMMCISNQVGGEYMSNALWEGIPLADLLQRAGVKPGATKVVFYAADDYSDSIHLSKAIELTTLMAVRMNGVALPDSHGFPARMLVPGIYGMKHCKWLTRIEVINYDYQGYWQQRGWSDPAPIRLTARIDTPLDGSKVTANRSYIAGVAFSGNRGISEVDVSTDGGQTWQVATLKQPLSGLTWVLWELAWQPKPGSYLIIARAIDLGGNVQDPTVEPPLPNGSSGYHSINVTVA